MATIIKKNGAFFTKGQDGLMAVSDPVQLRDLTSGRTPYTDESYSVADKFATPNVSSPSSSGVTPVPMAPGQNQGTPYDKFNLALMGMLKDAQAQSGNMSANKNLASLQSEQAGQITAPVGEQFAGASPSQINSVLSGRAGNYEPAINETSAVIQAKAQKMNQFNNLVTQARAIGEDFAKNLVPDEATLQNYRDLIEADPSQMSTILSAAGNDKTRQKILGSIDFSKLVKPKEVKAPEVKSINGVDMQWNQKSGKWETIGGAPDASNKIKDQLKYVKDTLSKAKDLAGSSGSNTYWESFKEGVAGATDYTDLVSYSNTLRANALTIATDPGIKKFFGPAMSNADVQFMMAAGTSLNPELQSPKAFIDEVVRLEEIMNKLYVAAGGGKLTSPDGKQEVSLSDLTPAEIQEAKTAGWK